MITGLDHVQVAAPFDSLQEPWWLQESEVQPLSSAQAPPSSWVPGGQRQFPSLQSV